MWICVDTDFLDELSRELYRESQTLETGAQEMHDYTQSASATLEGRQYLLSVAETKQVCTVVQEATENMKHLAAYASNLSNHIQKYLKCTYNRG